MTDYNEDLFECVTEIVASTMEETSVSLDAQGGAAVAEYFAAIYTGLAKLITGDGDEDGEKDCEETACTSRQPKYEVYEDGAGEFRFRLKAANGEIIAVSEGYTTRAACLKGIAAVQKCAGSDRVVTIE